MIPRLVTDKLTEKLGKGKAIILLGPRQVGKTTLLLDMLAKNPSGIYLDCDEPDIRKRLTEPTSAEIKNLIGDHQLVIIDESQRIKNIGRAPWQVKNLAAQPVTPAPLKPFN